jgi:hypothetical protein
MNNYMGKGAEDMEVLDNLPSGYMDYINGVMEKARIEYKNIPFTDSFDGYLHVQILIGDGKSNNTLVYGLQADSGQETQFLFYNPSLFMFNMIPLSEQQQIEFTKRMFMKHFVDKIDDYLEQRNLDVAMGDFRLKDANIVVRSIMY